MVDFANEEDRHSEAEFTEIYNFLNITSTSTAEKYVFVKQRLASVKNDKYVKNKLGSNTEMLAAYLQEKLDFYEEILQLEKGGIIPPPQSEEQTKAYIRVAAVFEKQAFWSGSLSDFVYAMDTLTAKGFLKANELEEALAESFQHKQKGKKQAQPLTPEKIKARRRGIKYKTHTPSSEIHSTMDGMLEAMPSKQKKD